LELDKATENRAAIAADLSALARVAEKQQRREAALGFAQRAYWTYRAIGDATRAVAELNRTMALLRDQGRQKEAAQVEAERNQLLQSSPPTPAPAR